jgi:NADH-quinone oxidoreductase subunit I
MVIVRRKELSLREKLYLPEIARGLSITFRKLKDDGNIACVSCGMCEIACPAYAITIDGGETDRAIEREPVRFEIDMLRCILCGFCEEACPKDAIFMSDELELADYSRAALIYDMHKLKRPKAALQKRIDYVYRLNNRWRKSSSTR